MKELAIAISPRGRKLLRFAAWGVLIVLALAIAPFLFDVVGRVIDWLIGLLHHPSHSWQDYVEYPWQY